MLQKVIALLFCIMWIEMFFFLLSPPPPSPLRWNARPSQGVPSALNMSIPISKWVGRVTHRESYEVSCLITYHNNSSQESNLDFLIQSLVLSCASLTLAERNDLSLTVSQSLGSLLFWMFLFCFVFFPIVWAKASS